MGLDNFWLNEAKEPAEVPGKFNLCGGMFSGHGNSSFRGKVYSDLFQQATNGKFSLYEEMTNEQVLAALEMLKKNQGKITGYHREEIDEFIKMWELHALAGHNLHAWY